VARERTGYRPRMSKPRNGMSLALPNPMGIELMWQTLPVLISYFGCYYLNFGFLVYLCSCCLCRGCVPSIPKLLPKSMHPMSSRNMNGTTKFVTDALHARSCFCLVCILNGTLMAETVSKSCCDMTLLTKSYCDLCTSKELQIKFVSVTYVALL